MNSPAYWNKRMTERLARADRAATDMERLVKAHYQQALTEVQKEISFFYSKYAVEGTQAGQMTMIQMQRITELEQQLATIAQQLGNAEIQTVGAGLAEHFKQQYQHATYDVFKDMGMSTSWSLPNDRAIHQILNFPWSGKNFSQRIWAGKERLMAQLESTLMQGFIQGKSNQTMASEIRKTMGVSYENAFRLVRTETNYVANQATLQGYKDAGLTKYKFSAHLDNRTSEICTELDNTEHSIDDAVVGVNLPPMHPHCRSTTLAVVPEPDPEDFDEDMSGMSFDEWLEKTSSPTQPSTDKLFDMDQEQRDALFKKNLPDMDDASKWVEQEITTKDTWGNPIKETIKYPKQQYDEYQQWFSSLTKAEKAAVHSYTYKGDVKMNELLRTGTIKKANDAALLKWQKATDNLNNALSKATLPRNVVLRRNIDWMGYDSLFGRAVDPMSLQGQVFGDKGFISTSLTEGKLSPFKLKINVPKGTHGQFIGPSSAFQHEYEVLLKSGDHKFKIRKVVPRGNDKVRLYDIYVDLIS